MYSRQHFFPTQITRISSTWRDSKWRGSPHRSDRAWNDPVLVCFSQFWGMPSSPLMTISRDCNLQISSVRYAAESVVSQLRYSIIAQNAAIKWNQNLRSSLFPTALTQSGTCCPPESCHVPARESCCTVNLWKQHWETIRLHRSLLHRGLPILGKVPFHFSDWVDCCVSGEVEHSKP